MEDFGSELRGIRTEIRRKQAKKKARADMSPLEQEREEMRLAEKEKQLAADAIRQEEGVKQARGEFDDIKGRLRKAAKNEDAHELAIGQFRGKLRTQIKEFNLIGKDWPLDSFVRGYAETIFQFAVDVRIFPCVRRLEDWDNEQGYLYKIVARW